MPFAYNELVAALGKPASSRPLLMKRPARGSLGQRPPVVTDNYYLAWLCGCRATMGANAYYQYAPCDDHIRMPAIIIP